MPYSHCYYCPNVLHILPLRVRARTRHAHAAILRCRTPALDLTASDGSDLTALQFCCPTTTFTTCRSLHTTYTHTPHHTRTCHDLIFPHTLHTTVSPATRTILLRAFGTWLHLHYCLLLGTHPRFFTRTPRTLHFALRCTQDTHYCLPRAFLLHPPVTPRCLPPFYTPCHPLRILLHLICLFLKYCGSVHWILFSAFASCVCAQRSPRTGQDKDFK